MTILPTRLDLVRELVKPGSTGAEIGVYRGGFSRQIYDTCRPAMLYCLDAWEKYDDYAKDSICHENQEDNYAATKNTMAEAIRAGRCQVIRGRSHPVGLEWRVPLDWIFLDSNHTYEFAIDDLRNWSRFVRPGGCIMCHDFTEREAALAMDFGVVRAVKEFCTDSEWELTHITKEADWPSCALQRKPWNS